MKTLRRLLPFLKPFRWWIAGILLLSVLLSILSASTIAIILPVLRLVFPDDTSGGSVPLSTGTEFADVKTYFLSLVGSLVVVDGDRLSSLRNLCFFLVALFAAKNVVKYATYVLNTRVDEGIIKAVRDRLFGSTVNLSLDFFNRKRSGDLISVITNDVGVLNASLTPLVATLIREPLQVFILLAILLTLSPTLTAVAFSTSILSFIVVRLQTRYIRRYSIRLQQALGEITARIQETLQNIRLIKGYAAERYEEERFSKETRHFVRSAIKHSATVNLMGPSSEMFAIVAIAVVLYVGGYLVLEGRMRADELVTFLIVLFSIMQPVVTIFSTPATVQRGLVAAERVLDLLAERPTVVSGQRVAPQNFDVLQLLGVGFSYRIGEPVLREVDLTVRKGQTVALVGPSGGGKSTMMDLIIRLYDPTAGGILLDGTDIKEFDLASYRSLFGIVTQESILFNDTVARNIAYGMTGIPEDRIVAAARMANAHEFIARLPDGYQTTIGDRGVLLSGGQRQRLAIARALARDPQILLFDEATSALDSESELLVQEAIERLLEERTAIIIAHRLSTIKRADTIVVVNEGSIEEMGRHEDLIAADGLYKRLHDVQFRDDMR